MSWWALEVRAPEAVRAQVGQWLVRQTGQAIEERPDGTLVGFAADAASAEALRARLGEAPGVVESERPREVAEVDWTTRWREGLGPRHLGRLVVAPSWQEYSPAAGEVVVVLDPEMAFGSGEHGSTRTALRLMERAVAAGARVLDLGSGSGILSIAAVRLGAAHAVGIEIDEEANVVARRNAERNGVAQQVRFLDGDAGLLAPLLGPADLIVSNILRTVNVTLFPAITRSLAPTGHALFAGMESAEAAEFRPELLAAGFTIVAESEDAGWWGVLARRG